MTSVELDVQGEVDSHLDSHLDIDKSMEIISSEEEDLTADEDNTSVRFGYCYLFAKFWR